MRCEKSDCSLIQRLNHGMSDARVRAVTSDCYAKRETVYQNCFCCCALCTMCQAKAVSSTPI